MGYTEEKWTQGSAEADMQLFIPASQFVDGAGLAVFARNAGGWSTASITAAQAATLSADIKTYLRTGVYALASTSQQQFGTAASVPGPSTVAGTSGPLALYQGYPPIPAASMNTLANPTTGPMKKGIQIDSYDVIYSAGAVDLSVATTGIIKTVFTNNTAAPVASNILAVAANGLPVAFRTNLYVKNVAITTPAMITDSDAELTVLVNLTAGAATGTAIFYGVCLHMHYNFN